MKGPGISEVVVRTATKADAADIYALLEACAPEIPSRPRANNANACSGHGSAYRSPRALPRWR